MTYAKLESQYLLQPLQLFDGKKSEIFLRVNIYKNPFDNSLSAIVERLDLYEIKPFSEKGCAHVDFWVKDDFCSMLIDKISKKNELQILESFIDSLRENGFEVAEID